MNNDKMLAYELMGVIADAKAVKFDDVCIETLERVCAALSTPADGEEQAVAFRLVDKDGKCGGWVDGEPTSYMTEYAANEGHTIQRAYTHPSPAANIQARDGWAEKAASIAMDCRSLNYEEFFTKHGTYDIRAAMEGIFATSPQQSGATFDDEAERITAELVGATGGINPDATSIDDIFDSPPQQQEQSGEAYKTCDICDGAKGGVPGNGNLINGQVVCDYCHADGSYPSPAKPTDSEGQEVYQRQFIPGNWKDVRDKSDV
jgi:hypothetical protein